MGTVKPAPACSSVATRPTHSVPCRTTFVSSCKRGTVDFDQLVTPSKNRDVRPKTYSVFHVENAIGSSAIPAQEEFVARYGVRSVVGCGGDPLDDMFATIFFSRVPVAPHVAE